LHAGPQNFALDLPMKLALQPWHTRLPAAAVT
jgi:hypothetical protein